MLKDNPPTIKDKTRDTNALVVHDGGGPAEPTRRSRRIGINDNMIVLLVEYINVGTENPRTMIQKNNKKCIMRSFDFMSIW